MPIKKRHARPKHREKRTEGESEEILRVPLPKKNPETGVTQVLGYVETRLGVGRSRVRCADGVVRVCSVPGRLRRRLWVRPDDIVLVEPWEFDVSKGNIMYNYRGNQIDWLKKKGFLKELIEQEEF